MNGRQQRILDFVAGELVGGEQGALGAGDDLLGSGRIDSLGVMRLVDFLEREFEVAIPPADVTIDHFMTVERIDAYLTSLGGDDGHRPGD